VFEALVAAATCWSVRVSSGCMNHPNSDEAKPVSCSPSLMTLTYELCFTVTSTIAIQLEMSNDDVWKKKKKKNINPPFSVPLGQCAGP